MCSAEIARSVGLSNVRSNSGTTGPRGAGSAVAGSADVRVQALVRGGGDLYRGCNVTPSTLLFPGSPSEVSSSTAVMVTNNIWIVLVPGGHCIV